MTDFEQFEKPKTEMTNLADLFKKDEYHNKLEENREYIKMSDMVDRPIIITGYCEDTLPNSVTGTEKPCLKLSFYFADDEQKVPHYTKSEAKKIWEYLKVVNELNPELLSSGTVSTMIIEVQMKGKFAQKQYFFAGTEN